MRPQTQFAPRYVEADDSSSCCRERGGAEEASCCGGHGGRGEHCCSEHRDSPAPVSPGQSGHVRPGRLESEEGNRGH